MTDKLEVDVHFAIVPRWVIRHPQLTAQAVRVYAVLADHAGKVGTAYPARSTIGRETGSTVKTVQRALLLLLDVGAITAEQQSGKVTVYTVRRMPPGTQVSATRDTGVPRTQDTDVPQKKTQSEEDKHAYSKAEHDALWDEFVRLFGTPVGGAQSRFHYASRDAAIAGIAPDELGPAMGRYKRTWESVDCNPQALVNNWHRFGPRASAQSLPVEVREQIEAMQEARRLEEEAV